MMCQPCHNTSYNVIDGDQQRMLKKALIPFPLGNMCPNKGFSFSITRRSQLAV